MQSGASEPPRPDSEQAAREERELAGLLWFCLSFLVIVVALVCWEPLAPLLMDRIVGAESSAEDGGFSAWFVVAFLAAGPFLAGIGSLRMWPALRRRIPGWAGALRRHGEAVDRLASSRLWWLIALAAGAGLFAELAIIRTHGSFVQLFSYFKNVSLLSCFLGLGAGYARVGRGLLWTPLFVPLMAVQLLCLDILQDQSTSEYLLNPVPENLALGLVNDAPRLAGSAAGLSLLAVVFAFNALCFVPMGQLAGRLMQRRERLNAYGWNLAGSILGVALFNLLSMSRTPPSVWLVFVVLSVLPFLRKRELLPTVLGGILMVGGIAWIGQSALERDVYSPYQKLSIKLLRDQPPEIQVANVYFQRMIDMRRPEGSAEDSRPADVHAHYEIHYELHEDPERVLVVGAGSGNDVAAALRHGARSVHAVEIDPVILELGRALHPEDPYSDPRVHAVVDDARAFLRSDRNEYDLVVYGLLDSHTLLSSAASVRLDSFVYTVEGFREARARLAPGGILSLSFADFDPRLGYKIFRMLTEAFDGRQPFVFRTSYDASRLFVVGDDLSSVALQPESEARLETGFADAAAVADVDLSTDDWPFFYMPERRYPLSYLGMVLLLAVISFVFVRRVLPGSYPTTWPCFFLGAGFMLIETKSITELALVFGSTWIVIGLVIVAILVLAYLANFLVDRRGAPPRPLSYGLLLVSVLAGLVLVSVDLDDVSLTALRILFTVGLTLPLFFSGLAFSSEVVRAPSIQAALSSNLLGAMVGGFVEYNAMYFGYRSLYFVALAMYAAAWIASRRTR